MPLIEGCWGRWGWSCALAAEAMKPLTPQGDDLSEPRVPSGDMKKADAQNSTGEEDVLLSKSPSSLSANIINSPKGEGAWRGSWGPDVTRAFSGPP